MATAERRKSNDSASEKKPAFGDHRSKSWDRNLPLALVYQQGEPHLGVEEINEVNSKLSKCTLRLDFEIPRLILTKEESNAFEIQLPRWGNRVFLYPNMEEKTGYPVSLRLDRLGWKKNWQRRLGLNYTVLHVKGKKPVLPV